MSISFPFFILAIRSGLVSNGQWHELMEEAFEHKQDKEIVETIFQQFDTDQDNSLVTHPKNMELLLFN